jgi:hypothetical protein
MGCPFKVTVDLSINMPNWNPSSPMYNEKGRTKWRGLFQAVNDRT